MILQLRTPRRATWMTGTAILACAAVVLSLTPVLAQPTPKDAPPTTTTGHAKRGRQSLQGTYRTLASGSAQIESQPAVNGQDMTIADAEDAVELLKAQLGVKKAELQEAEALLQQARGQLKRADSGAARDAAGTDVLVKEARIRAKMAQIKEGEVRLRQAVRHLNLLRHHAQTPQSATTPTLVAPVTVLAPGADTLRALTLQLEGAVLWEAVTPDWRARRDGWVKEVQQANSVPRLAELIKELEANILWSAVTENWKDRRDSWLNDCGQTKSVPALAKLLGELENYITWDAVDAGWKDARPAWVAAVEKGEGL